MDTGKALRALFLSSCALVVLATASQSAQAFEYGSANFGQRFIRDNRRTGIGMEGAWNGMVGMGPVLWHHINPHFTIEGGVGFSMNGAKLGFRGRYNFTTDSFTPFVGAGLSMASGLNGMLMDGEIGRYEYDVPSTTFGNVVFGLDWTTKGGFTWIGTVGYSSVMSGGGYDLVSGAVTRDEDRALEILHGGGLIIGGVLGYSF